MQSFLIGALIGGVVGFFICVAIMGITAIKVRKQVIKQEAEKGKNITEVLVDEVVETEEQKSSK